jgi:hypothetical protein
MISLLLALAAQASTNRLPPAQALPPPSSEEQAVLQPINGLFAAMAAKDQARIAAQVRQDGRVTRVGGAAPSGMSWAEFAAQFKPGEGPALQERLVGMPAVEIDGDMAMVWAPYVFHIDGKLSHCGIDLFDMVREQGAWKVLNITLTKRTEGCAAQ